MSSIILNGKELASNLRSRMGEQVKTWTATRRSPGLAVVLVGENPASQSYVTAKEKTCHDLGMISRDIRKPAEFSETELLALVDELNQDPSVDGILIQLPLPDHMDAQKIIHRIDPSKDVDGFHPVSIGKMVLGEDTFLPCTPHGVVKLLELTGLSLAGKEVVILGRSNIVGKPLALLLMQAPHHCTVTVCHTKTVNLKDHTLRADIIIAAVGRPHTLKASMVKAGTVVIDVGVNRVDNPQSPKGYSLVGDVDYQDLLPLASHITPVPNGVGPMTITMLMYNTIKSYCLREGLEFPDF